MQRLRFYDCRLSRLPAVLGRCASDFIQLADDVNTIQRRLLYAKEAGDEGWWGTWAEMVFNVSRDKPYLTTPRGIARIEYLLSCDEPVPVQNQFHEYLAFGNGRLPKQYTTRDLIRPQQTFMRNNAVTFIEMTNPPQLLRAYLTDSADVGKRVLFQGTDSTDAPIYSQDGVNRVVGNFVSLDSPFVDTPEPYNLITGIQKDITSGQVQIFQVNPTTGDQVLILTMEPGEQTAWYRRYYMDRLPCGCCATPGQTTCDSVQVSALVKLELLPVVVDTDYCLIQNLEAIIEECQSLRYSTIDNPTAKQMAQERHTQAIRMLNGELAHYMGTDSAAVNFAPFGSAHLSRRKIGQLM